MRLLTPNRGGAAPMVPVECTSRGALRDESRAIFALDFLPVQRDTTHADVLFAAGQSGLIYVWAVVGLGKLLATFAVPPLADRLSLSISDQQAVLAIRAVAYKEEGAQLVVTDSVGYVFVYDVSKYHIVQINQGSVDSEALLLAHWRAHLATINAVQVIDGCIVTVADDARVRMWSIGGDYIGVFGQEMKWSVRQPPINGYLERPRDLLEYEARVQLQTKKDATLNKLARKVCSLGPTHFVNSTTLFFISGYPFYSHHVYADATPLPLGDLKTVSQRTAIRSLEWPATSLQLSRKHMDL